MAKRGPSIASRLKAQAKKAVKKEEPHYVFHLKKKSKPAPAKKKLKLKWASGNKPNYDSNPTRINRFNPKASGIESPAQGTDEYVFALLQPWEAYHRGFSPAVPDGNMTSSFRFKTKTLFNMTAVANGTTYDAYVYFCPFGNDHLVTGTSFVGNVPTVFTGYDVNGYSSWATNFYQIRCVAMGVLVRNLTAVQNQAGIMLQTCLPSNIFGSKDFSTMTGPTQSEVRGLGKPGDVGMRHWRPGADGSADKLFKDPTATIGSYQDSNAILLWSQSPTAQTFQYEVFAFWEARPLANVANIIQSELRLGDPTKANMKMAKALSKLPENAQARMVCSDDGVVESIAEDVKSIFGGVKSGINLVKTVGETVGGWLGFLAPHDKLHRMLHVFLDDETVFDLLVNYLSTQPHATLADVIIWAYNMSLKEKALPPRMLITHEGDSKEPSIVEVDEPSPTPSRSASRSRR